MEIRDIRIEGIDLKLARTPVVHLAEVERHLVAKTANTAEGRQAIVTAMFHGIRRARKECEACGGITLEWLIENVDFENGPPLFRQFFVLNGFVPAKTNGAVPERPSAGGAAPGEAEAAAEVPVA